MKKPLLSICLSSLLLAGCGGGSKNPTEFERLFVNLFFGIDPPSFAALQSGGEWQLLNLNGIFNKDINLDDPDGRFKVAIICPFRGEMRGYFYQATTVDIPRLDFACDDTSATQNYEFKLNISNSFDTRIAVGTNFRGNYKDIDSATAVTYTFDSDIPTIGDLLLEADGFNAKHRKVVRAYDYFSAGGLFYNPVPSDVGNSYPWDATKPGASPGFVGVGVKFNANNLKVVLAEDTSGSTTGSYNTVPDTKLTDFYTNYAWAEEQIITNSIASNFRCKISYLNNQAPTSHTYNNLPKMFAPEDVNFEENADGFPITGVNASYDAGVSGLSAKLIRVRYENPDIKWNLYSTLGHSNSIEFPGTELSAITGYKTEYDITTADFKDLTQYQSNGSVEQLDRYLMSNHKPVADDNGLIFSYARIY